MLLGLADRARKHLELLGTIVPPRLGNIGFANVLALIRREPSIVIATILVLNSLRVISTLILTRLLAPADFGILGMVGVASYALNMLFDLGTDSFIIRHPDITDRRLLDVVWTIRFVRLMIAAVVMALTAGLFARLLGNEALTGILVVAALGMVAAAPQSLSINLAVRNRQLVLVSSIDVFLAVLNLVVTVGLAFFIRNYWALVIGSIVATSSRSLLSYLLFPSPFFRFAFDKEITAEMWKFSRYVVVSSIITFFLSQIDKIVLGHFLTIGEFGTYVLAANIAALPQSFLSSYGPRVLFPTYSEAYRNNPISMRRVFHEKLRRVGPLYCFLVGGLIGFAPVVVSVMYQDRYAQAAYYLALLSIPSFFALSSLAATDALVAIGQVRATYQANLVRIGWLVPAVGLAIYSGQTIAILVAIALSEFPPTIFTWWKLRQSGVLSFGREIPTFLVGALGIVTGWGAYKIIGVFFNITPVGLLK